MNLQYNERRRPDQPQVERSRSAGITRIYKDAIRAYHIHDKACEERHDPSYQKGYRIYKHVLDTCNMMHRISEARGRPEWESDLGCAGALLHDIGKTHPSVIAYRLDRGLTSEEKDIVDRHSYFSGVLVEKARANVRAEDRKFLFQVKLQVVNHHTPWNIIDLGYRALCYDLMFVDALRASTEDRGSRLGLPQKEAVEDNMPIWIEHKAGKFPQMLEGRNAALAEDSLRIIQELYGYEKGEPKFLL